jgi:hypothetical protein
LKYSPFLGAFFNKKGDKLVDLVQKAVFYSRFLKEKTAPLKKILELLENCS